MGQKQSTIIPKAPVGRILFSAGAKRVSQGAIDAFTEVLENITEEIAKQAAKIAKHAGRKTIQDEDIKLAKNSYKRM